MKRQKLHLSLIFFVLPVLLFCASCHSPNTRNRIAENNFPLVILWAWERPEDLEYLDPQRFAVAFLSQTLTIKGEDVAYSPRLQPLKVHPNAKLIAVTRIESQKITGQRAALSDAQRKKLVERILKTLDLHNVTAVQVDFDAVSSERNFYRNMLQDLRRALPDNVPLSMTALASFCVGDRWLSDLPVDEAVPMVFRMGADSDRIKNMLNNGADFRGTLCQRSYGIALDEPITTSFAKQRRVYVFNAHSWTPSDVSALDQRLGL